MLHILPLQLKQEFTDDNSNCIAPLFCVCFSPKKKEKKKKMMMMMRKRMNVCFPFLILLLLMGFSEGSRKLGMETQNVEVQKQLNNLNKIPVKTIQSPDGDTIDCVPMSQQPAFDHPLLKNHSLQMRPNYHPEGFFEMNKGSNLKDDVKPIAQLWHLRGRCPEGTIPIRRVKQEDLFRASSVERFGKKKHKSFPHPPRSAAPDLTTQTGHQHAIAYVEGGKYYGAKGTINVWQPQIQQSDEFSLSQIWLLAGSFNADLNSIEAGWQVSPDLYGDNNTRLFTYWTSDAYEATGCYNLFCPGFIQINNDIALGASISPISSYKSSQYDISLLVWKDPNEGNWWMQFGNGNVVGYWPASLFSYLVDSASMVEWGGEVVNMESDGLHTTTEMGSGHFPGEGFSGASYFKNIQIVDDSNNLRAPDDLEGFTEQSNCYSVKLGKDGSWGNYFYYGGPGRNPDCP